MGKGQVRDAYRTIKASKKFSGGWWWWWWWAEIKYKTNFYRVELYCVKVRDR